MSQTKEGAKRAVETMRKKYGEDYFKNLGKAGGKMTRGYQFAHGKITPSEAGKQGGRGNKKQR